jgi:flagellar basal body rod protein FlgG
MDAKALRWHGSHLGVFAHFGRSAVLSGSRAAQAAASGMAAQQARLEILANNLANIDTPGFRRALLSVAARPEQPVYFRAPDSSTPVLLGTLPFGVEMAEPSMDLTQGSIHVTGRALDAAVLNDAFFVVSSNGQEAYTRAGALQIGPDGALVDGFGNPLLDDSGAPITIPQGTSTDAVWIGAQGEILVGQDAAGGAQYTQIARLKLVRLDPATVRPLGSRLYTGSATPLTVDEIQLQPAALEGSNVNVVRAMAEMIGAFRVYEANARTIQALMDVEGKAINELR